MTARLSSEVTAASFANYKLAEAQAENDALLADNRAAEIDTDAMDAGPVDDLTWLGGLLILGCVAAVIYGFNMLCGGL